MGKLNQILAVHKEIKARAYAELTRIDKTAQKPAMFEGFAKSYERKDEEGDNLPSERKRVELRAPELLALVKDAMSDMIDIEARMNWTNCVARADLVVEGNVLIKGAPATFLLFLEKQLTDLRTMVSRLPVLDEAEEWAFDQNSGLFATAPTMTSRSKKTAKAIVKYPATEQHPAQTEMVAEDVIVGHWKTVKQSGALPRDDKAKLGARVEALLRAVKEAREAANMADEVPGAKVAASLFAYLMPTG